MTPRAAIGARNYEVQSLTGATGWISAPAMSGGGKPAVEDLTSGTRDAFRARACGNGQPESWSAPCSWRSKNQSRPEDD